MKRRVIQLAGKTLVISLPSKWAKQHSVTKGLELEVEEKKEGLLISLEGTKAHKKKTLDVSGLAKIAMRMVSAAYKAGYDEIEVRFSSSEELDIVQKALLRSCIGFEIVQQGKNTLIAKSISQDDISEFDSLLRRLFFFLLTTSEDCLTFASSKNTEGLKSIIVRDDNINRLSDFCRRAINKNPYNFEKSGPLYFIIEALEGIGDSYKQIASYLIQKRLPLKKSHLELFSQINSFLRELYELFYTFDIKRFAELKDKASSIHENIRREMRRADKDELVLLLMFKSLLEKVFDISGPILAIQYV
ncbi:MAG: hypothetical protein QXW00_01575 [Candidatus Woesearchaeota archaeon]